MKTAVRPLLVAGIALLCAAPADCTILIRQDLQDLVRGAESIVRARVVSNAAAWDPDRRFIWTWTTLDVVETWKGPATGRIALRELGGEVGSVGMRVAGTPKYAVGEDVIVFLYRDAQGAQRTLGWTQGRFALGLDADGSGTLTAQASHAHVIDGGLFVPEMRRGPLGVRYAAFKAKTKSLIAALPASTKPAGDGK
jgi:hypothetical protein